MSDSIRECRRCQATGPADSGVQAWNLSRTLSWDKERVLGSGAGEFGFGGGLRVQDADDILRHEAGEQFLARGGVELARLEADLGVADAAPPAQTTGPAPPTSN